MSGLVACLRKPPQVGGGHRYWRVIATANSWHPVSGNYKFVTLWTIQMYASTDATGTDLCLGKTAAASSVYGAGYEAAKGNDGNNTTTRWASIATASTFQWWSIDLGANPAMIHSVGLYTYYTGGSTAYFPAQLALQYSDDNTNWTTQSIFDTLITSGRQAFSNL